MPAISELSELQRYVLIKYYFASEEEEQEDRIAETISSFKTNHPGLPWYPSISQVKAFIDAVDREDDLKQAMQIGSKKRVDTEENWEKIKAILMEQPKSSVGHIAGKTGIGKAAVTKMMRSRGYRTDGPPKKRVPKPKRRWGSWVLRRPYLSIVSPEWASESMISDPDNASKSSLSVSGVENDVASDAAGLADAEGDFKQMIVPDGLTPLGVKPAFSNKLDAIKIKEEKIDGGYFVKQEKLDPDYIKKEIKSEPTAW